MRLHGGKVSYAILLGAQGKPDVRGLRLQEDRWPHRDQRGRDRGHLDRVLRLRGKPGGQVSKPDTPGQALICPLCGTPAGESQWEAVRTCDWCNRLHAYVDEVADDALASMKDEHAGALEVQAEENACAVVAGLREEFDLDQLDELAVTLAVAGVDFLGDVAQALRSGNIPAGDI